MPSRYDLRANSLPPYRTFGERAEQVGGLLGGLGRGVGYTALDLLGTASDFGLTLTDLLGVTNPDVPRAQMIGTGDWLIDRAADAWLVQPRTGEGAETAGRFLGQVAIPGASPAEMAGWAKVLPFLLGTFKGMNANLSDDETRMLAKAFEMEQAGASREAIRQATNPPGGSGGWARAPWDQKWRIELDDSRMGVHVPDDTQEAGLLADFVSHPQATEAYPDLNVLGFQFGDDLGGQYKAGNITTSPYNARSVTLHEMTHPIQEWEGFARGGSPAAMPVGKVKQEAIDGLRDEISRLWATGDRESIAKADKLGNVLSSLLSRADADQLNDYRKLAGEAEARLVQARRDLTPAQRAAIDPYEQMDTMLKQEGILGGMDDLIVRYGDGPAMAQKRGLLDTGRMPKVEAYDGPVSYRADPDEYVYHVTTAPKAKRILERGFDPKAAKTVRGRFYENYSKNKVFFTDKDGLGFWRDRIEEHLDQAMDNPPSLTVLRVRKADLPNLKPDAIGSKDANAASWFMD